MTRVIHDFEFNIDVKNDICDFCAITKTRLFDFRQLLFNFRINIFFRSDENCCSEIDCGGIDCDEIDCDEVDNDDVYDFDKTSTQFKSECFVMK